MNLVKRRNGTEDDNYHYFTVDVNLDTDVMVFRSYITKQLQGNPLTVIGGSGIVTVNSISHGYKAGDYVLIIGAKSTGGLTPSLLNGLFVIDVLNSDSFTYEINERASETANGGGTTCKTGTPSDFKLIFDTAKSIFDRLWLEAVNPALLLISNITVETLDIIKGFWDTWGGEIFGGLQEVFNNVKMLFDKMWDSYIGPAWTNLLEELSWVWDKHLKGLVEELWNFVGKLVDAALDIYNDFIAPLMSYLIDELGPTFKEVLTVAGDVGHQEPATA
jgi:hypothetical protein